MKNTSVVLGILIVSVVLVVGGVYLAYRSTPGVAVTPTTGAVAGVGNNRYDWREIGINNGVVEAVFDIKNEGSEPLQLTRVQTSCMCTMAQLTRGEEVSPEFGMHDNSSYMMTVSAGEAVKLTVRFDPAFHGPNGVGPITRQVSVQTNDSKRPELTYQLTATVVK